MDNAVALVQTYSRVNGYLTVTEYPIVGAVAAGGYQSVTDSDVLAFDFGHTCDFARGVQLRVPHDSQRNEACDVIADSLLSVRPGVSDMIIGEVEEGDALLDRSAADPHVLEAALSRFGCCASSEAIDLSNRLVDQGRSETHHGHRVRIVAFGSSVQVEASNCFGVVLLGHIVGFLCGHMRAHWSRLSVHESKDPGLSFA